MLGKQVTEPAPPLLKVAAGVPRRLAQAIDRCLLKDRAERAEGPAALAEQLGHALEQRRELPIALRAFVKHGSRLDGPGILLYPFATLIITPLAATLAQSVAFGFMTLVGSYTLVPLAVLVNRARGLLKSGFDHADLGVAFRAEIERSREERAFGVGHEASSLETGLKWISAVSFGSAALSTVAAIVTGTPQMAGLAFFAAFVGVGTGIGKLVLLQRRRDVDAEFWGRVWTSTLGKWLFKVARAFTPTRVLPASLTHRPTELALGMAAEQLFETLPKETRRQLRELPDVVHKLESDAQTMRARLNELQEALADVRQGTGGGSQEAGIADRHDRIVADLTKERDIVQQRLKDAVAALETIRLNLLRLHAGTGSVRSLTTDLGLAREVARSISAQIEGFREVERALSR